MLVLVETHRAERTIASTTFRITSRAPFTVWGPHRYEAAHKKFLIEAQEPLHVEGVRISNSGKVYRIDIDLDRDAIVAFTLDVMPADDELELQLRALKAVNRLYAENVTSITLP